ncbi:MAG: carboxypeptidase-like regulatory domain-containing protein [Bryobacteraceae bacterium]
MFSRWFLPLLSAAAVLGAELLCVDVIDPSDLPLPRAHVSVTPLTPGGERFDFETNESGKACLVEIPEGLYAVEVGLTGFLSARYWPVRIKFPNQQKLRFQLPIGEVREGPFTRESALSGTLREGAGPMVGARICLIPESGRAPLEDCGTCQLTNSLGQYAFLIPAGKYRVEISPFGRPAVLSRIDLSSPGSYADRLKLPARRK